MTRAILIVLGISWFVTGIVIFIAPQAFYQNTPGLSLIGPFNAHFIRDVGLAFFASGAATAYGALRSMPQVVIAGSAWPFLHALFHLHIWIHRGLPLDEVFLFDLAAVIAPAILGLFLGLRLHSQSSSARR
jgi:hypothetical protein